MTRRIERKPETGDIMRSAIAAGLLVVAIGQSAAGQSPLDTSAPLTTISAEFGLADGPAWDGKQFLYFPDVKAEKLFRLDVESGEIAPVLEGLRISASFYRNGTLYLSDNGNGRIARLDGDKATTIAQFDIEVKPPQRPNDLVVDAKGNIYVTMTAQNQVFRVTPEGKASVAVDGIASSNGLILSPDEKTLYVAAYRPKEVWAYPVQEEGATGTGKLFARMDDGDTPGADGMSIDSKGNVYCSGATDVWIWSPEGKLLGKLMPPARPINCAFGGADLKTLYITGFGGLHSQRMTIPGVR